MTLEAMKQAIIQSGAYTAEEVAAMITGEVMVAYLKITETELESLLGER